MATKQKQRKLVKAEATHQISNLGVPKTTVLEDALHNAQVVSNPMKATISNPLAYIDELTKSNPFWGSVALRVLTNKIGYYSVANIVWDMRKQNATPKYESTIDFMNDMISEADAITQTIANTKEVGHDALPFVDGSQFHGAYKYLLGLVRADQTNTTFERPEPNVIYGRMLKRDEEQERAKALAEYDKFESADIAKSPTTPYLKAKIMGTTASEEERKVRKAQIELDHVHHVLRTAQREEFSDDVWNRLPLYAQFQIARSVYNQSISALAQEDKKPSDERFNRKALNTLCEEILLELTMANKDSEVRLAFEKEVLKTQHALIEA